MPIRRPTVLIVEDDAHNRTFLIDLLLAYGFNTLVALNGEEGVMVGIQASPDLILMDLGLPVLDGWTATRRLKAHPQYGGAPIIAVTGWTRPQDEELARAAGCDAFVRKPFLARELLSVMESLLGRTG